MRGAAEGVGMPNTTEDWLRNFNRFIEETGAVEDGPHLPGAVRHLLDRMLEQEQAIRRLEGRLDDIESGRVPVGHARTADGGT